MMDTTALPIDEIVTHYGYIFFRISGMIVAMPILSSRIVPPRIRMLLPVLITIVIASVLPVSAPINPFSLLGFILAIKQLLIGIAIGLIFQFVFQVVILGGQVVALQSGLGFATLVDPQSHETLPMVSQFYLMAITLLFLSLNGHLLMIQTIANSFYTLPINQVGMLNDQVHAIIHFAANIFAGAVAVALPAIISLLTVNLTFAVMTKSAPQLNIFTIGFPLTLIIGLAIMCISFPNMLSHAELIIDKGFLLTNELIGSPHG